MPRGKRRSAAEMAATATAAPQNTTEEETTIRQPTKRSRASGPGSRRVGPARNEDYFQLPRCLSWFGQYTSFEDPDTLGPDGMERFCQDIQVEPENVAMLVLAYRMGARQMGYFTQAEWVKGMTELQCDTPAKMHAKLEMVRNSLNDFNTFKAVYRYAYDFARDKDQRSMDIETARAMLQLMLARHWALFAQFSQFLEQSKYKVINKDQWCNILEFSRTISLDLTNYDIDGAWPVLLDEFVEWMRLIRESPQAIS